MLLELFGYLSGDDRFHEIAEVYHWEMVQVCIQLFSIYITKLEALILLADYQYFQVMVAFKCRAGSRAQDVRPSVVIF